MINLSTANPGDKFLTYQDNTLTYLDRNNNNLYPHRLIDSRGAKMTYTTEGYYFHDEPKHVKNIKEALPSISQDDPVTLEDQLKDLKYGQQVKLRNGKVVSFIRAYYSNQMTYPLLFQDNEDLQYSHTPSGRYYSFASDERDIVEVLPLTTLPENASPTMETPAPTAVDNTPAVDAVPAPTTMQDLFNAALAELSTSDQQIVQEHIKNRLIEVQRLRTLLDKAERELNDFMAQPLEEAILRLTRQSSYTGMRFRSVAAPKSVAELSGYGR